MAMKSEGQGVRRTLLIATHNPGKVAEYKKLLANLPVEVTSLSEQAIEHQCPETGSTFAANARQKATEYATITGLWTWADDSGLEVDALDGRPGVQSARYGGEWLTDKDRYLLLLDEMSTVPDEKRNARFRCAVCVLDPEGDELLVEESVEGMIARQPAGDNGFGYDPVFYISELELTMAQVPEHVKNKISHRAKAARAAKKIISMRLSQ